MFRELESKYCKTAEGQSLEGKLITAFKHIPTEFLGGVGEFKEVHNDYQHIEKLTTEQKAGYWTGSLINGFASLAQGAGGWVNPLTYICGGMRVVGNQIKSSAQASIDNAKKEGILPTSEIILDDLSKEEDIKSSFTNLKECQLLKMNQLSNPENQKVSIDGANEIGKLYEKLILTILKKYKDYLLKNEVFNSLFTEIESKAVFLKVPGNINIRKWFSWEFFSLNLDDRVFKYIKDGLNGQGILSLKKLGLYGIENLKVSDFGCKSDLNILAMLGSVKYINESTVNDLVSFAINDLGIPNMPYNQYLRLLSNLPPGQKQKFGATERLKNLVQFSGWLNDSKNVAEEVEQLPLSFYIQILEAENFDYIIKDYFLKVKSTKDLIAELFKVATKDETDKIWSSLPNEIEGIYNSTERGACKRLGYPGNLVLGLLLQSKQLQKSNEYSFNEEYYNDDAIGKISEIRKNITNRILEFLRFVSNTLRKQEAQLLPFKVFDLVDDLVREANQEFLESAVKEIVNPGSLSMYVLDANNVYEEALNSSLEQVIPETQQCIIDATNKKDPEKFTACLENLGSTLKKTFKDNIANIPAG